MHRTNLHSPQILGEAHGRKIKKTTGEQTESQELISFDSTELDTKTIAGTGRNCIYKPEGIAWDFVGRSSTTYPH